MSADTSHVEDEAVRVLVVDDEESLRHMLGSVLSREGFDVAQAASAEDALKQMSSADFDVVFSDVRMTGMTVDGLHNRSARQSAGPVIGRPKTTRGARV